MAKMICIMNWKGHCEDENRHGCTGCDYYQKDDKDGSIEDLRVWWIPQIPLSKDDEPFYVTVGSPKEGKVVLDALSRYDLYQFDHNIKPDYTNAGGLEELNEDEMWNEWKNVFGDPIDDLSIEDL